MSLRPSRAWLGNLAVMLLLSVIAWALLRLHLGDAWWQSAPLASQWRWAAGSLVGYAAFCTLIWWRGRAREDHVADNGPAPILLVWASQTGFAQQLCERSAQALRAAGLPVRIRALHAVTAELLQRSGQVLF
ncbi:MAG: sulfite reductase flavoprotein subunit alpha, partial [Stenotrophomonas sp.]